MKILVTGGAGFIGSHVADAYLEKGHEVVVLDDLSTGSRKNLNRRARFVEMSITDPGLSKWLASEKFSVINHHAAQVSVPLSVKDPIGDLNRNGLGALNILQAAAEASVERFIFISTGGAVYGEQQQLPITEETTPRPMSPYAVHKLLGETYLPYFAEMFGLTYVILRYANVYGPRQAPHAEAGVAAIFTENLLAGRPCTIYRYPDMPRGMIRDYVFASDIAAANLAALEQGDMGVFNIGSGIPSSTQDLYEALSAGVGVEMAPRFGPPRAGDLRRSLLDAGRARDVLGWSPKVALAEGCRRTVEWLKDK